MNIKNKKFLKMLYQLSNKNPEVPVDSNDLEKELDYTHTEFTMKIKYLEREGYINRLEPETNDGYPVKLTKRGIRIVEKMI